MRCDPPSCVVLEHESLPTTERGLRAPPSCALARGMCLRAVHPKVPQVPSQPHNNPGKSRTPAFPGLPARPPAGGACPGKLARARNSAGSLPRVTHPPVLGSPTPCQALQLPTDWVEGRPDTELELPWDAGLGQAARPSGSVGPWEPQEGHLPGTGPAGPLLTVELGGTPGAKGTEQASGPAGVAHPAAALRLPWDTGQALLLVGPQLPRLQTGGAGVGVGLRRRPGAPGLRAKAAAVWGKPLSASPRPRWKRPKDRSAAPGLGGGQARGAGELAQGPDAGPDSSAGPE